MLRGLVTYGPRQSLSSFKASLSEFAHIGINLDLRYFAPKFFLSPGIFLQDIRMKGNLSGGHYDFTILNSGASLMLRPRFFRQLLSISEDIGIRTFVLWRNAFVKFAEIERAIGRDQFRNLIKQLEDERIVHCSISEQTATDVVRLLNIKKPFCVYNCQAMPPEVLVPSTPDEPPVVLNVGSVGSRKAPDIFVRVAEQVCRALPSVKFTWIGAEAPRHIQKLIKEKGLERHVLFAGFIPEPYQYMKDCSLLFLPSSSEGFGLVLAEAMACSRTIFCFSGTGAAEVPGKTGVILPAANVEEAARQIVNFLGRPADTRINDAARERYIEMFSPAAYASRWATIIARSFAH